MVKPAWRRQARWALLRSQRSRPVARICHAACAAATRRLGRRLLGLPGVEGVLLRHTDPSSPAFVVGHSDLDLTLLLDRTSVEDPRRVADCASAFAGLARVHFYVEPQDLRFSSYGELLRLRRILPAPVELLYALDDWKPIAGPRLQLPPAPSPVGRRPGTAGDGCHGAERDRAGIGPGDAEGTAETSPRHPEFNKWWENMLQLQVLADSADLERGYARALFRCALKSHLILEGAEGRRPDPAVLLREDLSRADFRSNPELGEILGTLAADDFWTAEPRRTAVRVLHLGLRAAAAFFRRRASGSVSGLDRAATQSAGVAGSPAPRNAQSPPGSESPPSVYSRAAAPRAGVYDALRERLVLAAPSLPGLRSALAFPLPHCEPPTYRLELVLDDDLELADLAALTEGVRREFGGRAFAAADAPVEIVLVPAAAHAHPLYREGSACPFLAEHVHASAGGVFGPMPFVVAPTRTRARSVAWCRTYFPFHLFNLRRRPEWASGVLNFSQLASLRLYLETGQVVTDAGEVRRRYLERFGARGAERPTLERLLRSFGGDRPGPAEFSRLSEEYDRLEALLA